MLTVWLFLWSANELARHAVSAPSIRQHSIFKNEIVGRKARTFLNILDNVFTTTTLIRIKCCVIPIFFPPKSPRSNVRVEHMMAKTSFAFPYSYSSCNNWISTACCSFKAFTSPSVYIGSGVWKIRSETNMYHSTWKCTEAFHICSQIILLSPPESFLWCHLFLLL